MKRVVVVSDVQAPYTNMRQVNSLAGYIRAIQPDDVYCVGDVWDLPMVSRWTRNRRGEFDGNIQEHIDSGRRIMEKLGVRHIKAGNHDIRVERYVENFAPALSRLQELKMENLFGLGELGITMHREPWEFTPGWVLAHGDEGNMSTSPGQTAAKMSRRWGKSVVCSHTHRQAIIPDGIGFAGEVHTTLYGVEVGHMMNIAQATYLRAGSSNWTAGFGILDISNGKVHPTIVQMSPTGSFIVDGRSWEDGRMRKGKSA